MTLAVLLASGTHVAGAQGCAQCRDNVQAAPPAVQAAYRHAIELLAVCGASLFVGGVVLLRRYR